MASKKLKKRKYKKVSEAGGKKSRNNEVININGEITEEVYVDFCKQMSDLESKRSVKSIKVVVNTDGGSYYDGMAIASRILSSRLKVTCVIYGRAFSAGSVIAVAGDEVLMTRQAKIMVHELISGMFGSTNQLFKHVVQLLKEQKDWCEYMEENTHVPAEQWEQWMLEETYITADEALEWGIIDDII